jgi:hypothetical protein
VWLVPGDTMPTLHRTLQRLSQHGVGVLKDLVRELDGEYALEHFDVTIDQARNDGFVIVAVEFRGNQIWKKQMEVRGLTAGNGSDMSDDKLREVVTNTMRSHLNLVAQMHHARLDKLFPGSIQDVTMGYEPHRALKTIHVKFKNGHVAEGPEHEAKQDIFLARCMMLYNLPPI